MIILKNIAKEYETPAGRISVLKDVNLHVKKGEMVAIMGRNGCGKSTLLNIIGGITTPTAGEVWIEGKKTDYNAPCKLCLLRRNSIGYVVQNFALISKKTVFENVILPIQRREYKKNNYFKVKELLEELEIADKMNKYPCQLSNGEKQRVAIARALVGNKEILLADEPTGALDYKSAENTINLFRKLVEDKGITALIVTHDKEIANKCDRILHITYGEFL